MMRSMQAFLLMSAVSVASAGIFTDDEVVKLETFVEEIMRCRQIPGQTVSVVRGDETWTRGFGKADIEQGVDVTKDTLFGVGSVTKGFTTTLLAMMIDESNGRLTWTSKVKDVLGPDFAFVDEERTRQTTLRDLLTHRAGLQTEFLPVYSGYSPNFTTADLAKRFRFLPELYPFRDVYEYNNWAFALLGRIVEVLSGEPYEVTLEKRIFKPLGMNQSRIIGLTITTNAAEMAKPYYNIENKLTLMDPSVYNLHPAEAAGALASSAEDLAKWMHFLLRMGVTKDNVTLVKSTTLEEVFKFHEYMPFGKISSKPRFPEMNLEYGYGYAWYLTVYKGYNVVMHTGSLNSYTSYIKLYRDLDFGIFVSQNGPGTEAGRVAENIISFYITDILLGDQPWLNSSTACTFPMPWGIWPPQIQNNSDVTNTDVECIECFVGKYGQYLFGDVDIKKGPGSSLEFHYRRMRGSLNTTEKKTTFKVDLWDPYRYYARPGNSTFLIVVLFRGLNNGKYSYIDLISVHKITFTRGISFYDENIYTSIELEINGQSMMQLSNLLLVFASLCAVLSVL